MAAGVVAIAAVAAFAGVSSASAANQVNCEARNDLVKIRLASNGIDYCFANAGHVNAIAVFGTQPYITSFSTGNNVVDVYEIVNPSGDKKYTMGRWWVSSYPATSTRLVSFTIR
jgi:hypothetical protein